MKETHRYVGIFILTHVAAVALFLSWLLPPTSGLWQFLDEAMFRALNGSLRQGSPASHFWGWLNIRVSDLIPAVLLYVLAIYAAGRMAQPQRMQFIHRGLALIVVMLAVITAENAIEYGLFSYHRASPTLVLSDAVRLSQDVPAAKDSSPKSFPGDHGYVLVCFAMFFALAAPRRHALVAAAIAVLFTLPRLIAGAHWMTDIVIGSGAKALLTTGWLLATPLWDRLAGAIERGLSRLPINPVTWACQWWWGSDLAEEPAGESAGNPLQGINRAA